MVNPFVRKKYYTRKCYDEILLDKYRDLQTYADLIINLSDRNAKPTCEKVGLATKMDFEKITLKDISRHFGKANYMVDNDYNSFNIKICFYRLFFGEHKVKSEFHFYNNKLFLFNYTFSYLKNDEKNDIKKMLEEKYLNNDKINLNNDYILDSDNSVISFAESMAFTINYIYCVNSELHRDIHQYRQMINNKNKHRKTEEKKDLFRRL